MKKVLLMALLMQMPLCFAGAGTPCDKIEYAQLKDSSKKELQKEYCSAIDKSELNKKLKNTTADLANYLLINGSNAKEAEKDTIENGDAQVSCLKVAEDISAMMNKKFKSKPSICN